MLPVEDPRDDRVGVVDGEPADEAREALAMASAKLSHTRLYAPIDGIVLDGKNIGSVKAMDRGYRKAVQIVFQHPDSSLNPRQTVGDILARPLRLYGGDVATIPALLEEVRLPAAYARPFATKKLAGVVSAK